MGFLLILVSVRSLSLCSSSKRNQYEMLRRSILLRCVTSKETGRVVGGQKLTGAAAAVTTKPKPAPATPEEERRRRIFELRASPSNLHKEGMHSSLLSDHPLTQKAARDEMLYKQAKLAEQGLIDKAEEAGNKSGAIGTTEGLASNDGTREYTFGLVAVVLGYCSAHILVFNYFHPDEVRLPYDPVAGFVEDVREKRKETERIDDFWNSLVKDAVYDAKRAKHKPTLA